MARAGGFFAALIALLLFMVTNVAQALDSSAFEASLDAAEEAVASALRAARARDGHVDRPVGVSGYQVPVTASDAATNGDPGEGLHEGKVAAADGSHTAKCDAPCSVNVAGSLLDGTAPVPGDVLPASSVACDSVTPQNTVRDEPIVQAPAPSSSTGVDTEKIRDLDGISRDLAPALASPPVAFLDALAAAEDAAASARRTLVQDVRDPVDQVPVTASGAATNGDPGEGLDEGRMATAESHHSTKYDAPCSVDVAGLGGSTTLCSENDGQYVSDLLVVKSPGSDQVDVLASASAQTAPIVDGNGDSPNLPVVLSPHEAAEKEPGQDDGPGTEVESQRLPNQDEASTEGDHPKGEAMTNGLSRPSSPSRIGARHVATPDEPQIRGDSAPGTPASATSDMLFWVEYKHLGIAVVGMLLLVLTVKSRVGMEVAAVAMLKMSLALGRVPHGRAAGPRRWHPSRVGRVVLVVKIAVVDGSRALVSWVSERDWVRSTSAWTGGICMYVALAAFGMLRSDVTSRIKNWVASVLTRAFSVVRNQVSRARAVDLPTWLSIVEEAWMSLSVVILAATSKIKPMDESSPYMQVISTSDVAKWNAWWFDYRWVVVGILMPLFLGVMRMVTNDIVSMAMLAMCRVRGRLPQGRAARPYHWHTLRPAAVAVVAKIVVVDGLRALVWWVSKQLAANFVSGWREVFCWSVVLGSGAYMRSYALDVMSSITNGMVAVGTWVYSTVFHQRSPGRGAKPPRWHPFRAATAIFTAGLVVMIVARIAETGGWSASVVWASRGVTVFRGRLPLTLQLVSVSWKTVGVAAAAAALMAWVMVVYVAAAGLFFVCTNRMTFPIRILVQMFELYDEWGEPNPFQLRFDLIGRIYLMLVLPRRLRSFGLDRLCGNIKLALRVGLHRNVLCHAHGTDASLKAAVFSVLSRLEPGDDYTQVLLVARSFQDQCDLSVLFHVFAARTDTPMTVSLALHPDWQQEVRAQVVIGTASTLSILLDRGVLDPSNVTAFAVDLGNDDSSFCQKKHMTSIEEPCLSIKRMLPGTCQSMVFAGSYCRGVNHFATGLAPSPGVFRSLNLNPGPVGPVTLKPMQRIGGTPLVSEGPLLSVGLHGSLLRRILGAAPGLPFLHLLRHRLPLGTLRCTRSRRRVDGGAGRHPFVRAVCLARPRDDRHAGDSLLHCRSPGGDGGARGQPSTWAVYLARSSVDRHPGALLLRWRPHDGNGGVLRHPLVWAVCRGRSRDDFHPGAFPLCRRSRGGDGGVGGDTVPSAVRRGCSSHCHRDPRAVRLCLRPRGVAEDRRQPVVGAGRHRHGRQTAMDPRAARAETFDTDHGDLGCSFSPGGKRRH
ncbi:unnamed protein product [Ectocarpus sp. 4 AP-2014]